MILPQASRDFQKRYKAVENGIEIAKYLTYEDLLNFAMMKNDLFSKNKDDKFDIIGEAILGLANSHL